MTSKPISFKALTFAFLLSGALLTSCGGGDTNTEENKSNQPAYNPNVTTEQPAADNTSAMDEGKGVGPITNVEIGADVDKAMADKGKAIFESKCTACHNPTDEKKVGPGLHKVTERRKPEWIMNMALNPENMVQNDPTAKELLATYIAPMANQHLTEEEAREVLEYFRQNDKK
jgi:mono/diheme cytochrome c family protein